MSVKQFTLILFGPLSIAFLSSLSAVAKPYRGRRFIARKRQNMADTQCACEWSKAVAYFRYFSRIRMALKSQVGFGRKLISKCWEKNEAYQMQSNIIAGAPRQTREALRTAAQSLTDGYHTYALEWMPEYVAWSIDRQQVSKITGRNLVVTLVNSQSMRFNMWASTSEAWVGPFNSSILPVYQFVNYMAYYAYSTKAFNRSWGTEN